MGKTVLFCLPYAGGSATMYNKWKPYLDKQIELMPVELAGRGRRINEPFYTDMTEAIEDIFLKIRMLVEQNPFAFFGHSMGSVFVYELVKKIRNACGKEPAHIFVSGRYPPHIKKSSKILHLMPDEDFKDEILNFGGTIKEVFEDKKLAEIFIPIIKADYTLIENYGYIEENLKFKSRITGFRGNKDELVTEDELYEWAKFSPAEFQAYEFDGGHFFVNEYTNEITRIINRTLSGLS